MHIITFLTHILAHPLWQGVDPISPDLPGLLASFLALAGFAATVAAVINVGKFFRIIPDGAAPNVSLVLNLIGFAVLTIVRLFKPDLDVAGTDQVLAIVATVLTSVLALLSQLGVSKLINNGIKGLPIIGYSYSREQAKAAAEADAETVAALRARR